MCGRERCYRPTELGRCAGYTLVKVLLVVAILAALPTISVFAVFGISTKSSGTSDGLDAGMFVTAHK
jgi:hypothetical protein